MSSDRPTPAYAVPPPDKERPKSKTDDQICQKCGATFRWQPGNDQPRAPLVLRLMTGSDKCDCGYGKARKSKR